MADGSVDCYCNVVPSQGTNWYPQNGAWSATMLAIGDPHARHVCNVCNYTGTNGQWNFASLPTYCTIPVNPYFYCYCWNSCGGAYWVRVYRAGSYWQSANDWPPTGASWRLTGYISRPGGGSWVRSDFGTGLTFTVANCHGNGNPIKIDCIMMRVYYNWIVLNSLAIGTITPTSDGGVIPWSFNANGDGGCEWLVQWGYSSGSYPYNSGWRSDQLSGTGSQSGSYTITGEPAGKMLYVRFQARNSGDVAYQSSETSFRTLGGAVISTHLVMG